MCATGWKGIDTDSWSASHKVRVGRRFRGQIYAEVRQRGRRARTSRGRILRPWWCGRCPFSGPIEAHHVDYDQPWLVAWLCRQCHADVECGRLRLRARDLWDYSSLVRVRPHQLGNRRQAGSLATRQAVPF